VEGCRCKSRTDEGELLEEQTRTNMLKAVQKIEKQIGKDYTSLWIWKYTAFIHDRGFQVHCT